MTEISADLQAVPNHIAASVSRLCGADDAIISLVGTNRLVNVAHFGRLPLAREEPMELANRKGSPHPKPDGGRS